MTQLPIQGSPKDFFSRESPHACLSVCTCTERPLSSHPEFPYHLFLIWVLIEGTTITPLSCHHMWMDWLVTDDEWLLTITVLLLSIYCLTYTLYTLIPTMDISFFSFYRWETDSETVFTLLAQLKALPKIGHDSTDDGKLSFGGMTCI